MSNTNNHAAGHQSDQEFNWWLFVYTNQETKVTSFSFIDMGIGIFESLNFKKYFSQIKNRLGISSNDRLVQDLLEGKVDSSTGLAERGRGLPTIYNHSKHKLIKNFRIISNDVHANLESKIYKKLENKFNGTFLYWELHQGEINNGNS